MDPENQITPVRGGWRSRPDAVALTAAGILWVLIHGTCAIRLLSAHGLPRGLVHAGMVMAIPLVATVGWWLILRRVSARWVGQGDSPVGGVWMSNALLILAMALGAVAVYVGEAHLRAIGEGYRELGTTQPGALVADDVAARTAQPYHTLAAAAGLLELAVVTLGAGLTRGDTPEGGPSTTAERQ